MQELNSQTLWKSLIEKSRYIESHIDALERKRTGSYYTSLELTDMMMDELVTYLVQSSKKIEEYRFLEPCVGAGNFVFSYLKALKKRGLNKASAKRVLENLYVADINKNALMGYKTSLRKVAAYYWDLNLEDAYFHSHMVSGILIDVTAPVLNYISLQDAFGNQFQENSFDIVVTNPPYKNLKAERSQYDNVYEYEMDREKYGAISNVLRHFQYSLYGVKNLYKLFVEEIVDRYAKSEAFVSLLIPATILSDKSCVKLRTHLLKDMNIVSVKVISESSRFIDAQQSLCSILIQKGCMTDKIRITKDFLNEPQNQTAVALEDILNEATGNAIFAINQADYDQLRKLRQYPTVGELPFISNLRGELDLTANKQSIVEENTGYRLLRGRNIGYYRLIDMPVDKAEYVSQTFVEKTAKHKYVHRERIACQQIANMKKARRVTFAFIPADHVLGNSCNFICVEDNPYGIDHYALMGLFNTNIINWLFKLTSSNNHINNYEIDSFPVPTDAPELKEIARLTKAYIKTSDDALLNDIEELACAAYGLNEMIEEEKCNG